jgi:predicted Zn-dependent protease
MSITKDINDMMSLLNKLRDQIVARDLEISQLNMELHKANERLKFANVIGVSLAKDIVNILEIKCLAGCSEKHKTWQGFQNGNGTDVGKDIERLIRKAKRIIKQEK